MPRAGAVHPIRSAVSLNFKAQNRALKTSVTFDYPCRMSYLDIYRGFLVFTTFKFGVPNCARLLRTVWARSAANLVVICQTKNSEGRAHVRI